MNNRMAFVVLFNAYVRSKLEFASIVWDPPHDIRIEQIEMVQKKFFKFLSWKIFGIDDRLTTNSDVLTRHGACALSTRRSMSSCLYLFKLLNGLEINEVFLDRVNSCFNLGPKRFRKTPLFYLPFARIELFKSSPLYRILSSVNNLNNSDKLDILCTSLNKIKSFFTDCSSIFSSYLSSPFGFL